MSAINATSAIKRLALSMVLLSAVYGIWHSEHFLQTAQAGAEAAAPVRHEPNLLHLAADAPQRSYLRIEAVRADDIPALDPLQGRVAYNDDVTARISAPIAGRVLTLRAQIGDKVRIEQSLATLDAPDFAQARADFRKAQADAHLKQAAFTRAKLLFDGGVLAAKDFEAAQADAAQAQSEMARAAARLRNLGAGGDNNYVLRTHIGGVVTERHLNPGSEVQPDTTTPLFVVSDPTRLWVDIDLPEKDLDKVQLHQTMRIQSDIYADEYFDGVVILIGKVLDPVTRRVLVRCAVDVANEHLKPEMFVRATPLSSGVVRPHVPNAALITEGNKTFIFVEKSPGVIERREVALLWRGREESYIDNGLQRGERVVISGALLLNAEMAIADNS